MSRRRMLDQSAAITASLLTLGSMLGSVSACSVLGPPSFQGRGLAPGDAPGVGMGRAAIRSDTGLLARARDRPGAVVHNTGGLTERRQCRTIGVPSGWLAVAYESSSADCPVRTPGASDSTSAVVVIVRYETAPLGTRLDVCANQSTPSGWSWVTDESPDSPDACPGAGRDGETVRRIRRDR